MGCGLYAARWSDGTVVAVNSILLNWLGYEKDEVVGKLAIEVFVPPEIRDKLKKHARETLGGDVRYRVITFQRKDGTKLLSFTVNWRFSDGDFDGFMALCIPLSAIETAKRIVNRGALEYPGLY